LADPTRRAVLEALRHGPRSVGEVASTLPVTRPAVSQHLGVLTAAGLVTHERAGTRRLYRLAPAGLEELRRWVEALWDDALASFAAAAESPAPEPLAQPGPTGPQEEEP
jgi:DNA-binding transcriptional ArsR family regulator